MPKITLSSAGRFSIALASCCFAMVCFSQAPAHSISGADANKLLMTRVEPAYPESVKGANVAGFIWVNFDIQKDGTTSHVQPLYIQSDPVSRKFAHVDHPEVEKAVVDAVRQWKYRPYTMNGESSDISTMTFVNFDFCKDSSCQRAPSEIPVLMVPATPIPSANAKSPSITAPPMYRREVEVEVQRTRYVVPEYPRMARIAHVQGDVVLRILIDTEGLVSQMKAVSGHPLLISAAMDAVKKWQYRPFVFEGKIVEVEADVTVHFRM